MEQIFSFGERYTIQLGFASLNGTFHLSPHENICTIALINIRYLFNISKEIEMGIKCVERIFLTFYGG